MVLSKSPEGVLESTARSKARGHDFKVNEYYPVLVDATLATRARTAMTANSRYGRGNSVPTSDKSERPHNLLRGLLKFLVVASLPVLAKVGGASAFYSLVAEDTLWAQLAGIVVVFVWNYAASSRFVWNSP